jgi:rhamnosyltransferase
MRAQLATLSHHSGGSISLHHCPDNNLAMAQNIGIRHIRNLGLSAVLLLDDDSRPAPDMVSELVNAYNSAPQRERVGLVAPAMHDTNSRRRTRYPVTRFKLGFASRYIDNHPTIRGSFSVIASGSLIPLSVLDTVGEMDESYVIDYIDKEFCLRLIKHGYETLVVQAATLHHSIGKARDHSLLGAQVTALNHSPQRRYYIFRNRLRTMARYGLTCPAFITFESMAMAYDLLRIVLFEESKIAKLKAAGCGVISALTAAKAPPLPNPPAP